MSNAILDQIAAPLQDVLLDLLIARILNAIFRKCITRLNQSISAQHQDAERELEAASMHSRDTSGGNDMLRSTETCDSAVADEMSISDFPQKAAACHKYYLGITPFLPPRRVLSMADLHLAHSVLGAYEESFEISLVMHALTNFEKSLLANIGPCRGFMPHSIRYEVGKSTSPCICQISRWYQEEDNDDDSPSWGGNHLIRTDTYCGSVGSSRTAVHARRIAIRKRSWKTFGSKAANFDDKCSVRGSLP